MKNEALSKIATGFSETLEYFEEDILGILRGMSGWDMSCECRTEHEQSGTVALVSEADARAVFYCLKCGGVRGVGGQHPSRAED